MQLFLTPLTTQQKAALNALADGIECGAALRPQGFEQMFMQDYEPMQIKTCALGAAYECKLAEQGKNDFNGISREELLRLNKTPYVDVLKMYGVENHETAARWDVNADNGFDPETSLVIVIWALNDRFKWTREAIAAWLRTLK